jgi:hypothetical protein
MRNPFIAGSWVRGENFFGRQPLLREVLEGERDSLWVVGARRLGKTSLLKELENRVQQSSQTQWAALYWDLEGSGDTRGLAESLLWAVEDSEHFRRATGVAVEDVEGLSVTEMLGFLVRKAVRSGWRLLLLIDEAEELLSVARGDHAILPRLRRLFQKGTDLRTVLTATRRLARVDLQSQLLTSPFLQGFIPPLYLTPLEPEDCRQLLARGQFAGADVETILERTARHPFLVQLIASRFFENGDLAATLEQVGADEMVANFFSVDFQTLEPGERAILEEVAREGPRTRGELAAVARLSQDDVEPLLYGLRMLGYLQPEADRLKVGNAFFERWLRRSLSAGAASGTEAS